MPEQRRGDRIEVRATVTVFDGQRTYGMQVVDMSHTGAYLATDEQGFFRDADLGRLVDVVFVSDAPYTERTRVWGSIVRLRKRGGPKGPGFAVRFMPMPPHKRDDIHRLSNRCSEAAAHS